VSAGYAADSVPTMVIGPAMIDSKYRIQPVAVDNVGENTELEEARPSADSSDGCS